MSKSQKIQESEESNVCQEAPTQSMSMGSSNSSRIEQMQSLQNQSNQSSAPINSPSPDKPAIIPPIPGVNKIGFIDQSNGANIRTGPAESGGKKITANPLPPATRVFVSGKHPDTAAWWYVTATTPNAILRGYVQNFRVNTQLPEPTAQLYQIKPGDNVEKLAKQKYSSNVTPGRDLRFYENVLLYVNKQQGRAGITGSYQDPNIFGGGSNNIQLTAGKRIWLVSPSYANAVSTLVPSGSFTGGAIAKARAALRHIDDLISSVTNSPQFFSVVAGEYASVIKEHIYEIIGITSAFIAAEAASVFLAATPTGVGQAAAVIIQLALAAFGTAAAVTAGVEALKHGKQWLTTAWKANGDATQLAEASKEFLKMLVQIAITALAIAGVKGNVSRGLKVADAIKVTPPQLGMTPTMVGPNGTAVMGGPVFTPGSISTTGPVSIAPNPISGTYMMAKKGGDKTSGGSGSSVPGPKVKARNLQPGDKIRTPHTHPKDFTRRKAQYVNQHTGEIWEKSHTNHSHSANGEFKVGLNKGKGPTKSSKITVSGDGVIIKIDK